MAYVISQPCIDVMDMSCVEVCPVDCIYEGARMLYIQPDECVDCGACEPACPESAIFYEGELPDETAHFERINAEFFAELGSPGGARKVGPVGTDHPEIV